MLDCSYSDGYGDGSEDGSGDGDGHGDGYGDGYGHGFGDGYGNGFGDGDGDGHGEGYGYGSDDGYGDDDGYGYGYGYGDGDGYGDGHEEVETLGQIGYHPILHLQPWPYLVIGCECHSIAWWLEHESEMILSHSYEKYQQEIDSFKILFGERINVKSKKK